MAQLDRDRYKRLTRGNTVYGQDDGLFWDATASQLVVVMGDAVVARIDAGGIAADLEVSGNARGDLLRRGDTALERLAAKGSGTFVGGDGTDVVAQTMGGDATLNNAGVLTIDPRIVKYAKITCTPTQIKAINAQPRILVAAPGSGYTTVVRQVLLVLNWESVAYANNGILGVYETDSTGTLLTGTLTLASFLAQVADTQKALHASAASATVGLTRADNKAIVLSAGGGECINGDSPVDVHIWYSTVPTGL
jgi:hypothetical protein